MSSPNLDEDVIPSFLIGPIGFGQQIGRQLSDTASLKFQDEGVQVSQLCLKVCLELAVKTSIALLAVHQFHYNVVLYQIRDLDQTGSIR